MDSPLTQRKKLAEQKPAPEPLGPSDAFISAVGAAEPGKPLLTGGSNVQRVLGFKDPQSRAAYESWAATKLITAAHERQNRKEVAKMKMEKKAREEAAKAAHVEELNKARTQKWKVLKKEMLVMAVEKSKKAINSAVEAAERDRINAQKVSEWTEKKMQQEKKEREKLASRSGRRSSRDVSRRSIVSPRASRVGAYSASGKKAKSGRRRSAERSKASMQLDEEFERSEVAAAGGGNGSVAQVMVVHDIPSAAPDTDGAAAEGNGDERDDNVAGMAIKACMGESTNDEAAAEERGFTPKTASLKDSATEGAGAGDEVQHKLDDADNVDSASLYGPDSRIASGASLRTDSASSAHARILPQTPELTNDGGGGGDADADGRAKGGPDNHLVSTLDITEAAAAAALTFEVTPPFGMSLAGSAETGVFVTSLKSGGNAENTKSISGDTIKVGMRFSKIDGTDVSNVGQVQITYMLKNPEKAGAVRAFGFVDDQDAFQSYETTKSRRLWAIVYIQSWWRYRIKKKRGQAAAAAAFGGLEGGLNQAFVEGHPNQAIPAEPAAPVPTHADAGGLADDLNKPVLATQAGHPSYTVDAEGSAVAKPPGDAQEAEETAKATVIVDAGLTSTLK